jgi:hypothetical protein
MNLLKRITAASALAVMGATTTAQQFGVLENVVEGLEPRMNRHQFFGSHNAYQDDQSITSQLDGWNVWMIELDVRWENGAYRVFHHCLDGAGSASFDTYLSEIAATERIKDGLFFLNLEVGPAWGTCDEWGEKNPGQHMYDIEEILKAEFGESAFYSNSTLKNLDNNQWPSVQELLRRGIHIVPISNWTHGMFHPMGQPEDFGDLGDFFWNNDDPYVSIPTLGDKFMSRFWEGASCAGEDEDEILDAVDNGFNFIDTNCVGEINGDYSSKEPFFHPPYPMYVVKDFNPGLFARGTHDQPFQNGLGGLLAAVNRISQYNQLAPPSTEPGHTSRASIIPVRMEPGTYDVGSGYYLNTPVTLQVDGGSSQFVRLQ